MQIWDSKPLKASAVCAVFIKAAQKEKQKSRGMRNVENWLALMSGSSTNLVNAKDNEQLRDGLGRDRLWTVPLALLKGPIRYCGCPLVGHCLTLGIFRA